MGRGGFVKGLWLAWKVGIIGRWGSIRRTGETEGLEVAAGICGGANKGNSCCNEVVSSLRDARPLFCTSAYRALELGPSSSATLDDILNANISIPKLLLLLARDGAARIVAAAISIHALSISLVVAPGDRRTVLIGSRPAIFARCASRSTSSPSASIGRWAPSP